MTGNSKRIVVIGDRIKDVHLLKPTQLSALRHDALRQTVQVETPGGADFLAHLLQGLYPETEITSADDKEAPIKVYQIWKAFPARRGDKTVKAFRVEQVVGRSGGVDTPVALSRPDTVAQADLLLIDSLGLGWLQRANQSDQTALATLAAGFHGVNILIKLSSMRDGIPSFGNDASSQTKLTVAISANSLRERGAAISLGLSWDRTIEETVHEFHTGLSSHDLARCHRVAVLYSLEAVAVFERDADGKMQMINFVYDPKGVEGSIVAQHEGYMFGSLSLLTAALAGHLVDPVGYPMYPALCLALHAMRTQLVEGLPVPKKSDVKIPDPNSIAREQKTLCLPYALKNADPAAQERKDLASCLNGFATAYRHDLLSTYPVQAGSDKFRSCLLADAAGYSEAYMAAKAFDVVLNGAERALGLVPSVVYGNFRTVDREEIERINTVRNLILSYRDAPTDRKPLSLAIFGPPGSGKSFAVKELAKALGFDKCDMIEFNLSQFRIESQDQLHEAFHQVRDATIRGGIPLVFWDEFDASNYRWLREFLAPMQDAIFTAGSINHPFGKAIFLFAGGVHSTFQSFNDKTNDKDAKAAEASKTNKIPDFISRLRGYINIKGPNPLATKDSPDHEHLIRRALLLRVFLQSALGRGDGDRLPVSAPLVQAFLRVKEYHHGARSLEALVRMCERHGMDYLGESSLPPDEPMAIHVNAEDFRNRLTQTAMNADMTEIIAKASHQGWMAQKKADGYDYGPERCDVGEHKTHRLIMDYDKLAEADKHANRCTALITLAKFAEAGIEIAHRPHASAASAELGEGELDALYRIEHDVWLRDHLLSGYTHCEKTNDELRLHNCVKKFDDLTEEEQRLDKVIIDAVLQALQMHGYILLKAVAIRQGR